MSTRNINWPAVASWLRKEASEHIKGGAAQAHAADIFMGLARAIDYGIETQELAESKDQFFGKGENDATLHEKMPTY
jgi:hypothetical protein